MTPRVTILTLALLLMAASGCDWMPGKPERPEIARGNPAADLEFTSLWNSRCAGCHGTDGDWGGARPMNDAVYQSIVTDDYLLTVTSNGVDHTLMPAFVNTQGGELTSEQIDIIVTGIRATWGGGPKVTGAPALTGTLGTASRGAGVFKAYCSGCHGDKGTGATAGSVVDPSYLALVSNQALRSTVICGRTDLGMPDWRGLHGEKTPEARSGLPAMTDTQVSDVVAWLASHRIEYPGQPYPVLDQPGTGRSE